MAEGSVALSALVLALGWALLHFLWQGALIAVVYGVLHRASAGSSARHRLALGHLALLACAAAPAITFALHWPAAASGTGTAAGVSPAFGALDAAAAGDAALSPEAIFPWLVAAWAAGVMVLAARTGLQWWALRLLAASAQPLPAHWLQRLSTLQARMGVNARVALRESSCVVAPLLVGWVKPTILLPIGLSLRLPPAQLEAVLAHELAHVGRLDTWINALQCALETLLYYHPAVHWIGRHVRADREECCDVAVTASGIDRLDYARALLALGESHREQAAHGRLAIAATDGVLLARVERLLLGASPREASPPAGWPTLGLAALVCACVLAVLPRLDSRVWSPVADALWTSPSPVRVVPLAELVVGDLVVSPAIARPLLPLAQSPDQTVATDPVVTDDTLPRSRVAAETAATAALADAAPVDPAPAVGAAAAAPRPRLDEVLVEPLRPLRQVAPAYPRPALSRGLEGSVALSFRIDAAGRPTDIVVESSDGRVFDAPARAALERWRFPQGDGSSRQVQTFDFRLDDVGATAEDREACNAPTGSRICRRAR